MPLSTAKDRILAPSARSRIGRIVVMRELPAALMTASSESVFIIDKVCATAMPIAKGTTTGMTDGRISVASSKNANADCPLVVTKSIWVRTCVVHTIARVQNKAAAKTPNARRRM